MSHLFWLIVLGIYGACVGSFLNVVMYRLPAGKSLVRPSSFCPRCNHKLAWYDNVPVLAWFWLRARCRYCAQPISIQYPIVETITALLFVGLYWVYYMSSQASPWTEDLPREPIVLLMSTWPALVVHLALLAGLLAASVIDARSYLIPLEIPWTIAGIAAVIYPLGVLMQAIPTSSGLHIGQNVPRIAPEAWSGCLGAIAGAMIGLLLANVLVWLGVIRRSFDDEPAPPPPELGGAPKPAPAGAMSDVVMTDATASAPSPPDAPPDAAHSSGVAPVALGATSPASPGPPQVPTTSGPHPTEPSPASAAVSACSVSPRADIAPAPASDAVVPSGPALAAQPGAGVEDAQATGPEQWLAYPHARREVLIELLFLGWPVLGALLGFALLPQWQVKGGERIGWDLAWPQAVHVLGGVCAGYLFGGGLIWGTRVMGTLAFRKEAMGLGDVHLMAAIGAVLGAADAGIAFFIAPFLGLVGALITYGMSRVAKGQARVIPYGPYLALAAVAMMVFRTPIHGLLATYFGLEFLRR